MPKEVKEKCIVSFQGWINNKKNMHDPDSKKLATTAYKNLCLNMKLLRKEEQIETIIEVEKIFSSYEYSKSEVKKNPKIKKLFKETMEDLNGMSSALEALKEGDYEKTKKSFSKKQLTPSGLPKDGFHLDNDSLNKTLRKRPETPEMTTKDIVILGYRNENIKIAKQLYLNLQREALGMKTRKVNIAKGKGMII